jgi:hypothetical protein
MLMSSLNQVVRLKNEIPTFRSGKVGGDYGKSIMLHLLVPRRVSEELD